MYDIIRYDYPGAYSRKQQGNPHDIGVAIFEQSQNEGHGGGDPWAIVLFYILIYVLRLAMQR